MGFPKLYVPMCHRSRLFTRLFSRAPVFLSFVLFNGFQSFLPAFPVYLLWVCSCISFSSVIPRVRWEFPFCFFMHLLAVTSRISLFPKNSLAFSDAFVRLYINDSWVSIRVPVCSVLSQPRVTTGSRLFPLYVCYPFASIP